MNLLICPCGSSLHYSNCCEPYHLKNQFPATAETLMRSRYSAFVILDANYLYDTTHPSKRSGNSKTAYLKSAKETTWVKLEILSFDFDVVEFKAYYLNKKFEPGVLHEKSNFKLQDGKWYYVDGEFYS